MGLPLALLYSEQKFPVTGFDIDRRKIDTLANGGTYIVRIRPEEIAAAKANGFKATDDYSQITAMDAIIICVPTPLNEYHEPDLSYITNTAHAVAPHLRAGQIVILESTTYPGTTEEVLIPILENENKAGLKASRRGAAGDSEIWVAFSPEREDPGNTEVARHDIPKVIGGLDSQASEVAAALYGSIFRRTVPVSSPAAAEMTKLLENIYRCVNIALVNELKMLCLRMGIDIWEIIAAAATKPFGFHAVLSRPGSGRTLHSGRSVLSFLEGEGVRLPHPLHRTGRRNQHGHALLRDRLHWPRRSMSRKSPSMDRRFWFWAWPTSETSTICASRPR